MPEHGWPLSTRYNAKGDPQDEPEEGPDKHQHFHSAELTVQFLAKRLPRGCRAGNAGNSSVETAILSLKATSIRSGGEAPGKICPPKGRLTVKFVP
jgi:hypothetical protein